MNIAALAHRFFLFGGAVLIIIAVLQWRTRQRDPEVRRGPGLLDATRLRIILFAAVGVLAILVGAGVIPMGAQRP